MFLLFGKRPTAIAIRDGKVGIVRGGGRRTMSGIFDESLGWDLEEVKRSGWRIIELHQKSPDAIAVKDGKVIAVEIVRSELDARWKRMAYKMFDDVVIGLYKAEPVREHHSPGETIQTSDGLRKVDYIDGKQVLVPLNQPLIRKPARASAG